MDNERRRWSGIAWALVAGCLAFAICCGLSATMAQGRRLIPVHAAMKTIPKACLAEFYAYVKVADLAKELGSDRDLLDGALDDLQDSLVDCLTGATATDRGDDDASPEARFISFPSHSTAAEHS